MNATPNHLPLQLSSFIGREREIAEVKRLLAGARLVTLTGAGGCGKTRLALEVAARMLDTFSDGAWLIDLAPLSDPSFVVHRLAATLAVHEQPGQPLLTTLLHALQRQRVLLALDNCEHLIEACAKIAHSLLQACPQLTILATSREALRVPGEVTVLVASLSVPPPQVSATALMQYEAVQLFVARATAAQSHFALADQNAAAVAQICQRLEGIPLALELAAALVKALSVEQIAARLDDVFHLLTGGSRTALPRHQTLRATIEWSYGLLSESERALFRHLSVFAGGWTLPAAEAVGGGEGLAVSDVLDVLIQLVNKSLVLAEERDGETYYRMLETIRQYAREKLVGAGEETQARDRHLDFFVGLAEQAEPFLIGRLGQGAWLNRLEVEHDNLRAALEWSRIVPGGVWPGLRLAGAIWWFWIIHDHFREGREWLAELLKVSSSVSAALRAKALQGVSWLTWFQSDQADRAATRAAAEESLAIFRALGLKVESVWSLAILGWVAATAGDYVLARSLQEEGLAIGREMSDQGIILGLLWHLGNVTFVERDYAAAQALYEESLAISRSVGHKWYVAAALNMLGQVAFFQGDYPSAQALCSEGLVIALEVGEKLPVAQSPYILGMVALHQGDYTRAASLYRESLAVNVELGSQRGIMACIAGLAAVIAASGQPVHAAQLLGAVEAMLRSTQTLLWPIEQEQYERTVSALRAQLDEATFAKAWVDGRAMTMEQAIAAVEQVTGSEAASSSQATTLAQPPIYPAGLTVREVEVLRLVAMGLTDAQVAERLVISRRTVNSHLYSIYSKLDVTTRTAAARYAIENKLI